MSTYGIRPARPGDGAGATKAWQDSADYYQQIAPDSFQSPRGEGLTRWMETKLLNAGDDKLVRVCECDGEAVGFVHATFLSPHEEADRQVTRDLGLPRVFVNALAVQRRHWRGGAGTALMKAVEQWGRERGARLLTLEAFAASQVSVPFYEARMGYQRQSIVFAKTLNG